MANRDSFNFKSTFKEKKVMKKSIVIFVVFCFCFWSGFLLAQNPDPTNIIGNPGDDEIVVYPTGVYNSGTKAMCAVTLPPLIASDRLTVYDGTNAPVTFTFVDADNGPYDLEIPIGPASWRLIGIYCFRNGIKVIPMGPWTFVHAEFGETGINGVASVQFNSDTPVFFNGGVDPEPGILGDGPNVQWAVDNVAEGGTVELKAGEFNFGIGNPSGRSKEGICIRRGITLEGEGMDETVIRGGGELFLGPEGAGDNQSVLVANYLTDPETLLDRERVFPNIVSDLWIADLIQYGMEVQGAETFEALRVKITNATPGEVWQNLIQGLTVNANSLYFHPMTGPWEFGLPLQLGDVLIRGCVIGSTTAAWPGVIADHALTVWGNLDGTLTIEHNDISAWRRAFYSAGVLDPLVDATITNNQFAANEFPLVVFGGSDLLVRSNDICVGNGSDDGLTLWGHWGILAVTSNSVFKGNRFNGQAEAGILIGEVPDGEANADYNIVQGNNFKDLNASEADVILSLDCDNNTLQGSGKATVMDYGTDNQITKNWVLLPLP